MSQPIWPTGIPHYLGGRTRGGRLQIPCQKFFHFCSFLPLAIADTTCRITASPHGDSKMLHGFEEINGILATMRDEGLVEPIDDPNIEVDFWDWADIIGVVDEFVPAEYAN